ncbi:MAG: long-chain fatty acid--CoA ligase [Blastocatellia bacterium]|nr:long-chain fatty acid--CoA ligase [Blastocatellia bacterium]
MQGQMMDFQLTITAILKRLKQMYSQVEIVTKTPAGTMHRYTYGDCYRRVCKLAHALDRLGVKLGDRVGTLAWNTYQHVELYYGIPCIGAVTHTINLRLAPDQLIYTINHAADKVVFVDVTLVPLLEKIAPHLTTVEHYVVIGAPPGCQTTLPNALHYEDLLAPEPDHYNWPELDENTAAGLCYTSGTTGNPKGALYSHRSQYLQAMVGGMSNGLGISSKDTIFAVVPMFHANAWGIPYTCGMMGIRQVHPGPHLKPADLAQLIQDEKVTMAAGVPTLWMGLYQELKSKSYDISALRMLLVGGAAMPISLTQAIEKDFNITVLHAWGMTEMSPAGTCTGVAPPGETCEEGSYWAWKTRQGVPVACVEVRIVDDEGNELPWDGQAVGEVQVRGPMVISSYYNDPSGDTQFTKDGWFITGDVATMCPKGSMGITDRSKDLIKSGGEWISSVALESALMAHPKVAEAAVISIPDQKWSERPMALVVARPGETPSKEELLEFISPQFAKFWLPEEVRFISEVPKTSVGKFDKKVLRKRYAEGSL